MPSKAHTVQRWAGSAHVTHTVHIPEGMTFGEALSRAEQYGVPRDAMVLTERIEDGPSTYHFATRLVWGVHE